MMLKSAANPEGLPMELFDGLRLRGAHRAIALWLDAVLLIESRIHVAASRATTPRRHHQCAMTIPAST
jgi:hypothetical protein